MTKKSKLAIVGGIMINCDGVGTDRFLPLKFELKTQTKSIDLFEEAFGKRPYNSFFNGRNPSSIDDVRASIQSILTGNVDAQWDASKYSRKFLY